MMVYQEKIAPPGPLPVLASEPPDAANVLAEATEAVHDAEEADQATTRSIAGAIEAGSRADGFLDQVVGLTRKAPVQSLAIAFLLGLIVARGAVIASPAGIRKCATEA